MLLVDQERLEGRAVRRLRRPARSVGQLRPSPPRKLPRTYVEARAGLRDPATVRSLAFRKAEVRCLSFEGVQPELVRFVGAMIRLFRDTGFPFVVRKLDPGGVEFVHFSRGVDLLNREWDIVASMAFDVGRRLDLVVGWGGGSLPYRPCRFSVC